LQASASKEGNDCKNDNVSHASEDCFDDLKEFDFDNYDNEAGK